MSEMGVHRENPGVTAAPEIDRPTGRRRSDRIVGSSAATQAVVDQAVAASGSELPVWIVGPPGSGKEHLARAIHAWSGRANGPFVAVACAAVAEPMLGRELFGCAASTHANLPEAFDGALARAAGGTLLIDRIDGVSRALRADLVKALSDGSFQRQGESATTPLRARIVATSLAPAGQSPLGDLPRHDIELQALAQRVEDVLPLAAHFLQLYADEYGIEPVGFTSEARNALIAEPWSGNVRELAERVRQALRLAGNGAISAEALLLSADAEEIPSFKEAKRAFETRYVVGLLRRCGGNISRAARLAKKDRKDFYDVIRRTGVDPSEFR
jgi:two-component system response regulator GlrR